MTARAVRSVTSRSVVRRPRHHPRHRAGPHRIPADLVERPPHLRTRPAGLGRLRRQRRAREGVRRRAARRHADRGRSGTSVTTCSCYLRAALHSIRVARRRHRRTRGLAWLLLLSAIPGAIVGALFSSTIEDELGDPILIGINLIVFGLVLEWADHAAAERHDGRLPHWRRERDGHRAGARTRARRVAFGRDDLGRSVAAVRPCGRDAPLLPDEHPDHRRRRALQGRRGRARRHPAPASAARSSGASSRRR